MLVFLVNSFFNFLDHVIREVAKSSLKLDIFFDGLQLREINIQTILTSLHFIKRKNSCLYGQTTQLDRKFWRRSPTGGADRKNVNIGRTFYISRFLYFLHQVDRITGAGCSDIRNIMSRRNGGHILLPCDLPPLYPL